MVQSNIYHPSRHLEHHPCRQLSPILKLIPLHPVTWDTIYTTNYDLLVEDAATTKEINVAGDIRPIFSTQTDLSTLGESDVPYYKLHGCIAYANTLEGRLILTKEDYRYYETRRRALFARLKRDLLSRTLVFIGYSLRDSNLRAILDECLEELGTKSFPLSYAIRPSFQGVEEAFWLTKYNVQLIKAEADTFLHALRETWDARGRFVIPFHSRKTTEYLQVEGATRFPKLGESFYQIRPQDCTGPSKPIRFFRGAEPSWADIRDSVPPKRDIYWIVMEALFSELAD